MTMLDDEQAKAFSEHWNCLDRWYFKPLGSHDIPADLDELKELLADTFVSGWEANVDYENSLTH